MNHVQRLNADLARALGVSDTSNVTRIVLTLEPGVLPRVEVSRFVRSADGLQTAVEVLRLRAEAA